METRRLNKYLSESGFCSRREADRLIEAGRVTVDGVLAQMGMKVGKGNDVKVDGKSITGGDEPVILAFNKPKGIVCTAEKREKNNIVDYINYPTRIYPIGRLDKDSTGLILMTNIGDLVNKIMRSGNHHEKEYIVTVDKIITKEFVEGMEGGVPILDTVTRKCKIKPLGNNKFNIVLTQGLNRQIRRMCEYFGYNVTSLLRVRIMNIKLGDLKPGEYRLLQEDEIRKLYNLTKDSSNEPVIYRGDINNG